MRSDITGITDKGAGEENECHLLGIKPDFQCRAASTLDGFEFDVVF